MVQSAFFLVNKKVSLLPHIDLWPRDDIGAPHKEATGDLVRLATRQQRDAFGEDLQALVLGVHRLGQWDGSHHRDGFFTWNMGMQGGIKGFRYQAMWITRPNLETVRTFHTKSAAIHQSTLTLSGAIANQKAFTLEPSPNICSAVLQLQLLLALLALLAGNEEHQVVLRKSSCFLYQAFLFLGLWLQSARHQFQRPLQLCALLLQLFQKQHWALFRRSRSSSGHVSSGLVIRRYVWVEKWAKCWVHGHLSDWVTWKMGKVLVCWGFEGDLHGLIAKNIGERLIFNGHPRLTVGCMVITMIMRLIFEPTENLGAFF